jgi:hypothetical protein
VVNRIDLSWAEYDFLWEHYELGSFQPILEIKSTGRTMDERDELRRAAWKSLAAKDLGNEHDFDPRLRRWLGRLAHPVWELDARLYLTASGPRVTGLIAWSGTDATVAVLNVDLLTLWTVPSARASSAAVWMLPQHPPGTGSSITIPGDTLDSAARRAGADRDALARALVAEGLGKGESNKLADVAGSVVRLAHFGAAHTPRGGERRRADHVVSVYDTHQHRYLFSRKPSGDTQWVTLTPGTDTAITRQLDELCGALARH